MNLQEKLVNQYNYTKKEAIIVAHDLDELHEELIPLFKKWMEDNTENGKQEFEGYSINTLKQKYEMNFIAALLTLDWIVKSPVEAISQLKKGIR